MTKNTILVVEDERIVAEDIRSSLNRLGYKVSAIASTGEEAIRKAAEMSPDLVLMDIMLQGNLDGVEAAAHIRSYFNIPIVYLTAYADNSTLQRAKQTEPFGYLLKPIEVRELHSAIETALYKHGMEKKLKESERWLATTLRSIGDAVIATDARGRIRYMNPVSEALTGWSQQEAQGRDLTEVFHIIEEETREPAENPAVQAMREGAVIGLNNHTLLVSRDQTEIPIDDSAAPIRDDTGNIVGSVLVFRDITERKRAEAALRTSRAAERRLTQTQSAILNALPAHVALLDRDGTIIAVNETWKRFDVGDAFHGARFAVGINYLEACAAAVTTSPGEAAAAAEGIRAVADGRLPAFDLEYACHVPDQLLWFHLLVAPLKPGTAEGAVVMYINVTDRKLLEEQLRQAQKMEAIGRLAGGVAHDFNNLLTAILGYADFMLLSLGQADQHRHDLLEIRKAADRASALTRQLLAFSRKQMLLPKVLDLNVIVGDSHKMLRRLIGEDIELTTHLEPALGRVKADPSQIVQVILNLALNARDAMPEGGRLTLKTANVELDASYTRLFLDVEPGPYVMLAVSDTGCGMDETTRSHLFEPFFTTKPEGKGTGLGLSTVYGIIKQSGGHIAVSSELGKGTIFEIYLPRIRNTAAADAGKETSAPLPRGTETILLVEDEDMVRELVRTLLVMNGYTVLDARHPREALQLSEKSTGDIHLLVTDVVMPIMSGRELAQRLAVQRPALKVLYMSGHTSSHHVRLGTAELNLPFLQKPFKPDALARLIREVLDAPPLPPTSPE
jgi:PAS domain S-box-containing protein